MSNSKTKPQETRTAQEIAADFQAQAQKFLDAAATLQGKDLKLQTKIKR